MKKLNCIWVLILLIGSGCASSGDISGGIIDEVTIEKVGLEQIQTDVNECRAKIGLPPLLPESEKEKGKVAYQAPSLFPHKFWIGVLVTGVDMPMSDGLPDVAALEEIGAAHLAAELTEAGLAQRSDRPGQPLDGYTEFKLKHCLEQKGYGPNSESDDKASQQAFTVVDKRAPLYLRYLAECNSAPRAGLYRKKFKSEGEVFGDCASGVWVIEESIVDRVEYEQDFVKCYELAERSEVTLKGSYLSKQRELYHLSRARDNLLFSCLANRHYEVGGPYLKQD